MSYSNPPPYHPPNGQYLPPGQGHQQSGYGQTSDHYGYQQPPQNYGYDQSHSNSGYDNNQYISESSPLHNSPIESSNEQKDPNRCRDPICAIAVLLNLIFTFAFGFYSLSKIDFNKTTSSVDIKGSTYGVALLVFFLVALVFSFIWLSLMKRFTGSIIKISYVLSGAYMLGMGIWMIAVGQLAGIMFIVSALFCALAYWCVRSRIAFTEKIMEPSVEAVQSYSGVFVVAFIMTILCTAMMFAWTLGSLYIVQTYKDSEDDSPMYGILAALAFNLYWNFETIANVAFTTTCGVVGSWWLSMTHSSTCVSFGRASTKSLGSVAFGSFLVSAIATLNFVIRSMRRDAQDEGLGVQLCLACVACLGSLLERLVRYFNRFAYAMVGLYGDSYIDSATAAFDLLQTRGFDAIINDDLSGMAIFMGVMAVGFAMALISGVVCYALKTGEVWFYVVAAYLMGVFVSSIMLRQVYAAVTTTFIVWAQEPNTLQQVRPQQFEAIQEARNKMYL